MINYFPFFDIAEHAHIFNMIPMAPSKVPFHRNTRAITRYCPEDFPLHLAVHEISSVTFPPVEYTQPHVHEDHDEINIIISQHDLLYRIQIDNDKYTVANNSCIWIPRGTIHAANVLKGSGHFVTIRMK